MYAVDTGAVGLAADDHGLRRAVDDRDQAAAGLRHDQLGAAIAGDITRGDVDAAGVVAAEWREAEQQRRVRYR